MHQAGNCAGFVVLSGYPMLLFFAIVLLFSMTY
jgi:hypothetical protein